MKYLLLACLHLVLGAALGLGFFEAVLHANPALLLRGMALPAPVDPPLTDNSYEVRYSDADIFFWHADLIQPIPAKEDKLEALVRFRTDEFGFPNPAPLPASVDMAVLGRSYSLGAQASSPWPRELSVITGWEILNLSQAGSSLSTKRDYLKRFGLPRQPRWVVVEVLPSMDIIDFSTSSGWLVPDLPVSVIQNLGRRFVEREIQQEPDDAVYPIQFDLQGRSVELTFFSYYLASLSVDRDMFEASSQWKAYRLELMELVELAKSKNACVVLLYAPTKENIYFPLVKATEHLAAVVDGWHPWKLSVEGHFIAAQDQAPDVRRMKENAHAARDLLADFARQNGIPFIDPTETMTRSVLSGVDPFMVYDTHWSESGHRIVAQSIQRTLQNGGCP